MPKERMWHIASVRFAVPQAKVIRDHAEARGLKFSAWVRFACEQQLQWEKIGDNAVAEPLADNMVAGPPAVCDCGVGDLIAIVGGGHEATCELVRTQSASGHPGGDAAR